MLLILKIIISLLAILGLFVLHIAINAALLEIKIRKIQDENLNKKGDEE